MFYVGDHRIQITDDDLDRWTGPLNSFFREVRNMDDHEAEEAIKQLWDSVSEGWKRAPKNLDTRIKMKVGMKWKGFENLVPAQIQVPEVPVGKEKESSSVGSNFIYQHLNPSEKEWWDSRYRDYTMDFDFNDSADKPLITQLLFEELMQRRLFLKQLKGSGDYGKELTESLKRVTELQLKLGITREQRLGILDNIDGNLAEISMYLDKKLDSMPKQMKKNYEEEARYQNLKNQKPPVNILPARETMKAIVDKGSDGMQKISNTAAQEISELAANKSKEEKESIELPGGERLE